MTAQRSGEHPHKCRVYEFNLQKKTALDNHIMSLVGSIERP